MPTAKMSAIAAKGPRFACAIEASTGPLAWARMSQRRKTRIPVANALRKPWTAFGNPCIRATGRPRKIVAPAMAPSPTAAAWFIVVLSD